MWGSKRRRQVVSQEQLLEMQAVVHSALQRVKQIEDDLASLSAKYERIRTKVYYKSPADQPHVESKAEILARMGYLRASPPKGDQQ